MHEMQRSALSTTRARSSVQSVRRALVTVVIVVIGLPIAACVHSEREPVKPLRTPRQVSDIVGIWRTVHQNVLELRQKGTVTLITSVSEAQAADFVLDGDHITITGMARCGRTSGTYRIQVAFQQKLVLSEPDDPCAFRRTQLTIVPYVYSNPSG